MYVGMERGNKMDTSKLTNEIEWYRKAAQKHEDRGEWGYVLSCRKHANQLERLYRYVLKGGRLLDFTLPEK